MLIKTKPQDVTLVIMLLGRASRNSVSKSRDVEGTVKYTQPDAQWVNIKMNSVKLVIYVGTKSVGI